MKAFPSRPQVVRRLVLIALCVVPPARAQHITVTLLGTGDPAPVLDRFGPAILVEAGHERLLFDAGRGTTQRLAQLNLSTKDLTGVLLTHLHSDHVVGLADVWLTGWLMSRRAAPLELLGPAGTTALAANLVEAHAFDTGIRLLDNGLPRGGAQLIGREVAPGVVVERNGIRVTAFAVDHGLVQPAFGYRIEYGGRAVVLSGDTRASSAVVQAARGADLLIHCVAAASERDLNASQQLRSILSRLATPETAADVFREAGPRLAVFSHISLFSGLTPDDIVRRTRAVYSGAVLVGEDLLKIEVGEDIRVAHRERH